MFPEFESRTLLPGPLVLTHYEFMFSFFKSARSDAGYYDARRI